MNNALYFCWIVGGLWLIAKVTESDKRKRLIKKDCYQIGEKHYEDPKWMEAGNFVIAIWMVGIAGMIYFGIIPGR